jgi:hypothetical protein
MPVTKTDYRRNFPYIEIISYKFETVHSFTYLGYEVNCKNDVSADIKERILSVNRCFHGLTKHLKS